MHDLHLPGRTDNIPDLRDSAHVAVWEPYKTTIVVHVSLVGCVRHKTPAQHLITARWDRDDLSDVSEMREDLSDLSEVWNDLSDLSDMCSSCNPVLYPIVWDVIALVIGISSPAYAALIVTSQILRDQP